jgi:hypothetical protein
MKSGRNQESVGFRRKRTFYESDCQGAVLSSLIAFRLVGSGDDAFSEWAADAGDAGDTFRLANVNDDGRADLVYGRALNSTTVRWFVRKSNGSGFRSFSTWADDAGNVGDLFFLADVDKDGDTDLVYLRAVSSRQVKWWVRRSDGSKFGSLETVTEVI